MASLASPWRKQANSDEEGTNVQSERAVEEEPAAKPNVAPRQQQARPSKAGRMSCRCLRREHEPMCIISQLQWLEAPLMCPARVGVLSI